MTMLIIAHRGASARAPENTLAAFRLAFADGADGLEFDVQIARDGVPVVIHDASLQRTGLIKANVHELSSAELARIGVGAWFNRRFPRRARDEFTDERLPLLTDVFDLCKQEARAQSLYVELKCDDEKTARALAASVVEILRADERLMPRVVVESFYLPAILEIKRRAADVRTAALFERTLKRPRFSIKNLLAEAKSFCADEIALHRSLITPRAVESARRENLPVVAWTVDASVWARRAVELGLRAVITNNPARMRAALDEFAARNAK
jgi:glycerophosphoryl diester phosphodiesterase